MSGLEINSVFSRLTGNNNVKLTLRRLTAKGRVPNSLLFTGDDGVGKRQFALEVIKTFLCSQVTDGEACDVCSACRRALHFTLPKADAREDHKRVIVSDHPDVGMVIPYNGTVLIDAIRHLETEANFRPFEGSARFFIIDDADRMNRAASNALLKTLEEPPESSYIFLITSRPDSLLSTIRSRCQTIRFSPVSSAEIEDFLVEARAFTRDESRLAARMARGSVSRAVSMDVEAFRKRRDRMFGVVGNAIQSGSLASLLKTGEEMNEAKDKEVFEEHLNVLQSLIHDIWKVAVTGDRDQIENSDLSDEIEQLASESGRHDLAAWMRSIDEVRANLKININRKVAADALFVSMAGV